MTNDAIAIRTHRLRKAYRVYNHPFGALLEAVGRTSRHVERVALDNVDLELRRGEIVGILGRNGAGKSTLLKLIAGTLERTSGELEVNGRITAILELGTGFHPDYTGRENIYMGGFCLGMSRREINRKVDSIIDFSELREVIDEPFKTYSTGMQARLTFSTAISVDPDILIVDEALGVGDARFQAKCFSWIRRLKERNATVLLVSHDTNTITSFCDRGIILESGRVVSSGNGRTVASQYLKLLFGGDEERILKGPPPDNMESTGLLGGDAPVDEERPAQLDSIAAAGPAVHRYGDGASTILSYGLKDEQGKDVTIIESGTKCRLAMRIRFNSETPDVSCGFAVKDRRGTVVFGITNISQGMPAYHASKGEVIEVSADLVVWLATGDYFVNVGGGHLSDGSFTDFIEDAIHFQVTGPPGIFTTSLVNLQPRFSLNSELIP